MVACASAECRELTRRSRRPSGSLEAAARAVNTAAGSDYIQQKPGRPPTACSAVGRPDKTEEMGILVVVDYS